MEPWPALDGNGFMFESLSFVTTQLWRLRRCMQAPELSEFAPDGKTAEDVSAMVEAAEAAKNDFVRKSVGLMAARGALGAKFKEGHAAAVRIHAGMRSCYRRHPAVQEQLRGIPKKDETVAATLARLQKTSEVWANLPEAPGTNAAFQQGDKTRAVFEALRAELSARHATCADCEQEVAAAQSILTGRTAEWQSFARAAVTQGLAQFDRRTTAWTWLNTIPAWPGTKAPRQARIKHAASPVPGVVRLEYDVAHATSFTIRHQGPADEDYAVVAAGVSLRTYETGGLAAGAHSWIVIPRNSRGPGPASKPVTVTVAAAQAA